MKKDTVKEVEHSEGMDAAPSASEGIKDIDLVLQGQPGTPAVTKKADVTKPKAKFSRADERHLANAAKLEKEADEVTAKFDAQSVISRKVQDNPKASTLDVALNMLHANALGTLTSILNLRAEFERVRTRNVNGEYLHKCITDLFEFIYGDSAKHVMNEYGIIDRKCMTDVHVHNGKITKKEHKECCKGKCSKKTCKCKKTK